MVQAIVMLLVFWYPSRRVVRRAGHFRLGSGLRLTKCRAKFGIDIHAELALCFSLSGGTKTYLKLPNRLRTFGLRLSARKLRKEPPKRRLLKTSKVKKLSSHWI